MALESHRNYNSQSAITSATLCITNNALK